MTTGPRPADAGIFRVLAHAGGGADEPFNSDIGALLPIALCGPDLVVVSTPILHFLSCVVKAQVKRSPKLGQLMLEFSGFLKRSPKLGQLMLEFSGF